MRDAFPRSVRTPARYGVQLCGARTRRGTLCQRKGLGKGGRCPNHGGCSTGPKTIEGRQRISQVQRQRWAEWRATKGLKKYQNLGSK
jgi:hypothetical protein